MPRRIREDQGLAYKCAIYLNTQWQATTERFEQAAPNEPNNPLGDGHWLIPLVCDCLQSASISYHYVLPTQLLAKCVDPTLNAHALQAGYESAGAFDARTVAHDVIVPFDRNNHRVLGGSPEPYVNNPLRVPAVMPEYRNSRKSSRIGTSWFLYSMQSNKAAVNNSPNGSSHRCHTKSIACCQRSLWFVRRQTESVLTRHTR